MSIPPSLMPSLSAIQCLLNKCKYGGSITPFASDSSVANPEAIICLGDEELVRRFLPGSSDASEKVRLIPCSGQQY